MSAATAASVFVVVLILIVAVLVWQLIADIRTDLRELRRVRRQLQQIAPLLPRTTPRGDAAAHLDAAIRAAGQCCCSDDASQRRGRRQWRDAPGRGAAAAELVHETEGGIGPVAALGLTDSESAQP